MIATKIPEEEQRRYRPLRNLVSEYAEGSRLTSEIASKSRSAHIGRRYSVTKSTRQVAWLAGVVRS